MQTNAVQLPKTLNQIERGAEAVYLPSSYTRLLHQTSVPYKKRWLSYDSRNTDRSSERGKLRSSSHRGRAFQREIDAGLPKKNTERRLGNIRFLKIKKQTLIFKSCMQIFSMQFNRSHKMIYKQTRPFDRVCLIY